MEESYGNWQLRGPATLPRIDPYQRIDWQCSYIIFVFLNTPIPLKISPGHYRSPTFRCRHRRSGIGHWSLDSNEQRLKKIIVSRMRIVLFLGAPITSYARK